MSDVVVTVPMRLWEYWIAEGDLPGDPPGASPLVADDEWAFNISPSRLPKIGESARLSWLAVLLVESRGRAAVPGVEDAVSVYVHAPLETRLRPDRRAPRPPRARRQTDPYPPIIQPTSYRPVSAPGYQKRPH